MEFVFLIIAFDTHIGYYGIALTKHKEKLGALMSTINEVRNKITSKSQEIIKLQSDQSAMIMEIEKVEEQLKSIMKLMDDFHVIFLHFYVRKNFIRITYLI